MEAITSRMEAIAVRMEAIAIRMNNKRKKQYKLGNSCGRSEFLLPVGEDLDTSRSLSYPVE